MTDAERAAALADEIDDELNELRGRFAGGENDHFSFGLKFSSWDVIITSLRRLAEQSTPSPAPADLLEVVAKAMFCLVYRRELWEQADCRDRFIASAAAALSTIYARGLVIMPREAPISFNELRTANIERQALWCPEQVPDMPFRAVELGGEVGEALNVVKKLERERLGWRGSRASTDDLAQELADVVICTDLLAMSAGIDLGAAVVAKFNATSEKVGLPTKIGATASAALAAKDTTP